jgi:hypothetical protein
MPFVGRAQIAIERSLIEGQRIDSVKLNVTPTASFVKSWAVSADGRIYVVAADPSVFGVFVPNLEKDRVVRWQCYGSPAREFEDERSNAILFGCGATWRSLASGK